MARSIATAALLACALAGCGTSEPDSGQQAREAERLAAVVPIVQELGVSDYNNRDWCRHLSYGRGEFTSDTSGDTSTCNDIDGSPAPFDDQASADFDRLREALSETGMDIKSVSRYADGSISFSVEHLAWDYWDYIYDPGAPLPEDIEGELRSVRINDDWYWQWMDWN